MCSPFDRDSGGEKEFDCSRHTRGICMKIRKRKTKAEVVGFFFFLFSVGLPQFPRRVYATMSHRGLA